MTFDDVIPATLRVCEAHPGFDQLARACLVRDLQGQVRLVLEPRPDVAFTLDLPALAVALAAELGGYFARPLLCTQTGSAEERRLAGAVLAQIAGRPERWPASWPHEYVIPIAGTHRTKSGIWLGLARYLSKEVWLTSRDTAPPWPKHARTPPIVAFYSFKGGVGRSTLAGCVARRLVDEGQRVVLIDLDLEAPGAGTLFKVQTERGVIDFILDHLATGNATVDRCHAAAEALGTLYAPSVDVVPAAASLDWRFLEKLARLDYAGWGPGADEESPVAKAIRDLLIAVKDELKPDTILIDSRSGLHDLGGLSLHALAHVDVLLARNSPQDLAGLRLALQALARRKGGPENLDCVIVHSLAPLPPDQDPGKSERAGFREAVYDLFREVVYREEDQDLPGVDVDTASHYPRVFPRFGDLDRLHTMADVPENVFEDAELGEIVARIRDLYPSDEEGDEEPGAEAGGAPRPNA